MISNSYSSIVGANFELLERKIMLFTKIFTMMNRKTIRMYVAWEMYRWKPISFFQSATVVRAIIFDQLIEGFDMK